MQTNRNEQTYEPGGRVFLNACEVGQQLGLRKSRIYEMAAEGLLPSVRLGRRIWFPVRGLEALADAAIEDLRNRLLSGR